MKKIVIVPVLAAVLSGALWGGDFSLGTGGLLGGFFSRYTLNADGGAKATQTHDQFNYGGLLFFDATYGELAVIIQGGVNRWEEVVTDADTSEPLNGKGWETMLGFSLLGKYPYTLSDRFTLFPLLGIEYQLALVEKREKENGVIYDRTDGTDTDKEGKAYNASVWNSFWINLGAGADFAIARGFFVRGELLYGFRLKTPYEADGLEKAKKELGDPSPDYSGLTSGPSLRVSAGYRFRSL
jgi:opacity protein-like surface antigen